MNHSQKQPLVINDLLMFSRHKLGTAICDEHCMQLVLGLLPTSQVSFDRHSNSFAKLCQTKSLLRDSLNDGNITN